MLSKKQKAMILFLGFLSLLVAVVVAVPFRSFPWLNKIEDILSLELYLKLGLAGFALLLAIWPLRKKYNLVNKYRENSKPIILMCYFPCLAYVLGSIANIVYALSFDYAAVGLNSALSGKVLGIVVAVLIVYLVFAIYCVLRLHTVVMKLDKVGNILFDCLAFVIFACFVLLTWRVNSAYNNAYGLLEEYYVGNPILFVIYILVLLAFCLGLQYVIGVVKRDESLIFYTDSDAFALKIKQVEYNNAYNDTLDDFEDYFDENVDEYENLDIEEIDEEEFDEVEETPAVEVKAESILDEEEVEIGEVDEEVVEAADSEELHKVNAEKAAVQAELNQKAKELEEMTKKLKELEVAEAELRAAQEAYDASLAEFNQFKLEHVTPEVEQPKKKVKKIVPSFEKMLEHANSFSDHANFKVVSNAKGNLHKFYIGKKMFLVMQSTNNDYRISFISTPEKFVEHLTSRPGELVVPKNLKDNSWIKLTNKGKADPKFMRKVIKEAVLTAEQQIQDEIAAKAAARKAKAAEKRALKKAQQEAEKAAAQANE